MDTRPTPTREATRLITEGIRREGINMKVAFVGGCYDPKTGEEMLENGESILHTAMACGYSTESHFIMTFRKYWGTTPGTISTAL